MHGFIFHAGEGSVLVESFRTHVRRSNGRYKFGYI